MMTLWAMFRSPLMMGGDLLTTDKATTRLLTNTDIIAIDQHSRDNRAIITKPDLAVWTARPEGGDDYFLAVFNLADAPQQLSFAWKELGIEEGRYNATDLWSKDKQKGLSSFNLKDLRPHACVVVRLSKK
jgi:alpha-galactosidase